MSGKNRVATTALTRGGAQWEITHEPQPQRLGADAVDLRLQEVLGDGKDLLGRGQGARLRLRSALHLKVDVLQLQSHRLTLGPEGYRG